MDDQRIDALTATYSDFTGHPVNFGALVREKKRAIVESTFSADFDRLERPRSASRASDWRTRDLSPRQLREALARVTTALAVYRTYRTRGYAASERREGIRRGRAKRAHRRRRKSTAAVFDFLAALFSKPGLDGDEEEFIARWQQLSPAVMAKGVEDTTFYCFDRLVSCNEVGRTGLARRDLRGEVPRVLPLPERALAEQSARHLDPRQQAQRGCAHENLAAVGDSRTAGRRRCISGRSSPRPPGRTARPTVTPSICCTRP